MLAFRSIQQSNHCDREEFLYERKAGQRGTGLTLTQGDPTPQASAGYATSFHTCILIRQLTKPALEAAMSELDDFLTPTLTRQLEAEKALCNSDPEPRLAMWSTQDPVTVFGAMQSNVGADEVRQLFSWLATRFSNLTDYRFDLVAAGASGDLAYTVGYEHASFSLDGVPLKPFTLRVTHVYRRENGEWKIVHRHADYPPTGQPPPADASTE